MIIYIEKTFLIFNMQESKSEQVAKRKDFHVHNLVDKIDTFLSEGKPADVLIIKAHLLCEYYINHLLILNGICTAAALKSLPFSAKREKVKPLFDFDNADHKKSFELLGRLNELRNKVGHELEYKLSESDVDNLGYMQGKQYILDKYDVETDTERLRNILTDLVINIALILINSVRKEKKKIEATNQSGENQVNNDDQDNK